MNKLLYLNFCVLMGLGMTSSFAQQVDVDVTLKNLFADRDFDSESRADMGSWSQGIVVKAKSDVDLNEDLTLNLTGSLQYAHRLSNDKKVNDMIIPFDSTTKEQQEAYKKIAGSIGLQHGHHSISWGEQWLNTPLAVIDQSRQLVTIYNGYKYSYEMPKNIKLDIGHIDKYSPRSEEDFRKLSIKNQVSDGLTYADLKLNLADNKLNMNISLGELEDIYNQYSYGLEYTTKYSDLDLKTKFRYYYTNESGDKKIGDIDNQYFGLMQELGYKNHIFGVGIQKIEGDSDFPMLDGAVPVLSYVNWTQGTFNKANETSYHFTYQNNLSWLVKGLSFNARYILGKDYMVAGVKGYDEEELDLILNYRITEGMFKNLSFQFININYDNDLNGSYQENRIATQYQFKF